MAQSADSTSLCEICIGGPGEYYCQQCDQFFCGNCKLSHLRTKISKKHTFFSGQNINKEEKRLCIEHEERFLFYCHKCDTPVCSSCSVHTHRGHLMTDLTKSAVKLKFELVKIIESTITTSTSCIGKIEEDTKTYHQKTKAVNKTITEEGNYYKELIDKKVHSFVKLVQDETQKALGSMSTATKVYLDILEHCQQWQKKITEMETKSDVLLFKKLKHLKTDVDQIVLKQSLDTPRPFVSYTNKKLLDTDIDNLFGELTFHYSSGGGRSDTGKEKISLRAELTEALKNIEKIRQEYSDLSEKYETGKIATKRAIKSLQREKRNLEQEKANFRVKLDQVQSDLNRYKHEQVHEQDSSHCKIDNLLQQNRLLDYDRELLRAKIFSLENDKIKFEDLLNKSKEDRKKLQRDQDKLQDIIREKANELKDSEARLEINNDEKSSILKENKELKNILQEKLSDVKRLETRLQQYAEKFEDIPALKRHMDKLQSDNDELNQKLQEYAAELEGIPSLKRRIENLQTDNAELEKRGKHKDGLLQKLESTVQKMQKDNQKLQTEIISQNQNYDTLKIQLESLKDKNFELDERLRLSEAAGNKLRDNNPNITDLSDMNRPTSLAEKFSSLFTDEYTDAKEVIEDDMDEAASVKVMLDWLKCCYAWCQRLVKGQRDTLINRSIGFMEDHGGQKVVLSDRCLIFVKEFQKKIAVESLAVVGQICHVKSVTQQTLSREHYTVKYIKKCSELCWMMQISDPPLYLNFDVNSGENLNKNDYNVFTKSGSKIDYLVWPVLYLHKTGPMLAKGVAQGK